MGFGRDICVLGRQVRFSSKLSTFKERRPSPPVEVFCRFLSDDVLLLSKFEISSRPDLSTFVDVTALKLSTIFDRGSSTPIDIFSSSSIEFANSPKLTTIFDRG